MSRINNRIRAIFSFITWTIQYTLWIQIMELTRRGAIFSERNFPWKVVYVEEKFAWKNLPFFLNISRNLKNRKLRTWCYADVYARRLRGYPAHLLPRHPCVLCVLRASRQWPIVSPVRGCSPYFRLRDYFRCDLPPPCPAGRCRRPIAKLRNVRKHNRLSELIDRGSRVSMDISLLCAFYFPAFRFFFFSSLVSSARHISYKWTMCMN